MTAKLESRVEFMIKERGFYANLAKLAFPLALQNLVSYGVGLVDNIMVGSLGDLAISGVFVSNQIQNILQMLTLGVSAAMTVLAAQYLGKNDTENARGVVSIAVNISLLLGIMATALAALFPTAVLSIFTNDMAAVKVGKDYLRIVCFSYVLFCVNNAFLAAMRCVQNSAIGMFSAILGFAANAFFNWVFIFGNLGAPPMGVAGAALATMIARTLELMLSLVYVRFFDSRLGFRLKNLLSLSIPLCRDFIHYGLPVVLGDILWGIGGAVQVAILGRLGSQVLAANAVAGNLQQIMSVVIYSISGATAIIIGRAVGSGDYEKVKLYCRKLQPVFLVFGLLTGLAIFLSKAAILSAVFTSLSPKAYTYAVQFLTVFSVSIVGTAYQASVLTGMVRAGGATNFVLINDIIFVWGVVVPASLLAEFVFHLPPVAVFACLKCDQILKCAVAVVKLNRYDWMKKLTR